MKKSYRVYWTIKGCTTIEAETVDQAKKEFNEHVSFQKATMDAWGDKPKISSVEKSEPR